MQKVKYPLNSISAVMITKDAEATLEMTLISLANFAEIIVYDNGSTDRTLDIAREFDNVRLVQGEFIGFGATKNLAGTYATNDLLFSLDADEAPCAELLDEIEVLQSKWQGAWIGTVNRLNYFLAKPVHFGDWRNDWVARIYDRREHQFSDRAVHESLNSRHGFTVTKPLSHRLHHQTIHRLSQTLQKMDRYTELNALDAFAQGRKGSHPIICLLKGKFAFLRCYILRLGFLDGWRGFIIAYGVGLATFYKHVKVFVETAVPEFSQKRIEQNSD